MRTFHYKGDQWTAELMGGFLESPIRRTLVRFVSANQPDVFGSVNPVIGLDGMTQEQLEATLEHALRRED